MIVSNDLIIKSFDTGFHLFVWLSKCLIRKTKSSTICRSIIDDVEKLDAIQDGFIHYQLLRFFQVTRLQYLNSHILLGNRCVLQQQHVDCKIVDTFLKNSTKQHADGWDASRKAWAHMVLHLSHAQGGFGVTFNDITKDSSFYTTTSRFVVRLGAFSQERQRLWLPKDNLKDSSTCFRSSASAIHQCPVPL